MEKIYEENNNRPKSRMLSFSTVLSFAVALFAIVSLIAVGFNQISYAAPETSEITIKFGKIGGKTVHLEGKYGSSKTLWVPMMYETSDDTTNPDNRSIFCMEHNRTAGSGTYETDTDEYLTYSDSGLIYILNQSSVNGGPGIVDDVDTLDYPTEELTKRGKLEANDKRYLEIYATQMAMWMYLHEKYEGTGDPRYGELQEYESLKGEMIVHLSDSESLDRILFKGYFYNHYIRDLVEAAKTATNRKTVTAVLASESISLVGDSDTYQTDKITVQANPSSDLLNYSVDLDGLEGAYIVDKDGVKRDSLYVFQPSDYFYIRVPVNKVTNETKKVLIYIAAEFDNYVDGEYYVSQSSRDSEQKVVKLTDENYRVYNANEISFVPAPDTGMTTAQTIYFIGLIVLLCGVGIIYANAKPVEEK